MKGSAEILCLSTQLQMDRGHSMAIRHWQQHRSADLRAKGFIDS